MRDRAEAAAVDQPDARHVQRQLRAAGIDQPTNRLSEVGSGFHRQASRGLEDDNVAANPLIDSHD